MHRQEYYAIITHMDRQIGRILDALEASGQAENTYIFFTADHGLALGHHGLFGKQNLYDHSVRVPFVAVEPGIEANAKLSAPSTCRMSCPPPLTWQALPSPTMSTFTA